MGFLLIMTTKIAKRFGLLSKKWRPCRTRSPWWREGAELQPFLRDQGKLRPRQDRLRRPSLGPRVRLLRPGHAPGRRRGAENRRRRQEANPRPGAGGFRNRRVPFLPQLSRRGSGLKHYGHPQSEGQPHHDRRRQLPRPGRIQRRSRRASHF